MRLEFVMLFCMVFSSRFLCSTKIIAAQVLACAFSFLIPAIIKCYIIQKALKAIIKNMLLTPCYII